MRSVRFNLSTRVFVLSAIAVRADDAGRLDRYGHRSDDRRCRRREMTAAKATIVTKVDHHHCRRGWRRGWRLADETETVTHRVVVVVVVGRKKKRNHDASKKLSQRMSRSTDGTRKTTPHINLDSNKYIERTPLGQSKRGSVADGTDSAHIFGFGLLNAVETHTPGAPLQGVARDDLIREMNHPSNMRVKTDHGNRVLDERRDARIAHAFVNDVPLEGESTVARAAQAYAAAQGLSNPKYADALGEMPVLNPETGRTHKLRNHANFK